MVGASDTLVAAVFASALTSTAAGTLAYLRTRERRDHAGTAFVAITYGAALWAALFGLQLLAGPTDLGLLLLRAKWVAATPIVTTSLLFGLYYTGRGDWVTPRRAALLSVEPALAGALIVLDRGDCSSPASRSVRCSASRRTWRSPGSGSSSTSRTASSSGARS
ncbi:histidine kinase N-terminal 7TM domain-containing protein [Halobaculum litoreum]|uniref:Histidine kinase N-terminal 7TM domain-containing protein n=1 Tax=Halobaculum litoreum TaxID=3031998 RepID=A0ABD5XQM7_9EURY